MEERFLSYAEVQPVPEESPDMARIEVASCRIRLHYFLKNHLSRLWMPRARRSF